VDLFFNLNGSKMKTFKLVLIMISIYLRVFAQGEAAVPFLTLQQSPELWGAGQIGAAIPNNQISGFYFNPANLGYKAQNNFIGAYFLTNKTEWFNFAPMNFNTYGFSAGISSESFGEGFPFSIGIGYIHNKLDFGIFVRTDENGNEYGRFDAYDSFENLSIGIGYTNKISYNIGFSIKKYYSKLNDKPTENPADGTADGYAFDFGILIMAPVYDLIFCNKNELDKNSILPKINTSIGYSVLNAGKKVSYLDVSQSDPLPLTARLGYTIELGCETFVKEEKINLLSYSFTAEAEDILIKGTNNGKSEYQNLIGDINIGKHLIGLNPDSKVVVHKGHIFNFLETISIYSGSFNGNGYPDNIKTNGFTISLNGAFKYLSTETDDKSLKYIFDHFSIEYTNSKVRYDYLNATNKFNSLSFEFKNFIL